MKMMSGKRKRPSGHAYRKLAKDKAKRLKEQLANTPRLHAFFTLQPTSTGQPSLLSQPCTSQSNLPAQPTTTS